MTNQETVEETLSKTGDIITQRTQYYTVYPHYKSWFKRFFILIRCMSNKVVLAIRPINVGNMFRISSKVLLIPDDITNKDVREALFSGSAEHLSKIIYIIACAIQNDENEPSEELKKFITYQMDYEMISEILDIIFTQVGAKGFMKSIILMKGLNVVSAPEEAA
ncbi:hypothetical protein [Pedobacter sp. Leaf170]|uniref:hypothetical protein n=1 Tax=Pedobacter sp. Leaf170 TaxID=2876558 RepID=UPI001E383303|nr:hypothetical protein [Pedobacter sp. Leaf170]